MYGGSPRCGACGPSKQGMNRSFDRLFGGNFGSAPLAQKFGPQSPFSKLHIPHPTGMSRSHICRQACTNRPCVALVCPPPDPRLFFSSPAGPGAHGKAQRPRRELEPRPPLRGNRRPVGCHCYQQAAPRGREVRPCSCLCRWGARARVHRGALRRIESDGLRSCGG